MSSLVINVPIRMENRMPYKSKSVPPAIRLWADYQREKSVHRVGALYGVCGETIRLRLIREGYRVPKIGKWSSRELTLLREWYQQPMVSREFGLAQLAKRLGRLKSNVCRKARSLGLTQKGRRRTWIRKVRLPKFATKEEAWAHIGRCTKERFAKGGHPRGAKGMKHSAETRKIISERSRARWRDPNYILRSEDHKQRRSDQMMELNKVLKAAQSNPYSRARKGRRADLNNQFFRSSYEANYARFLNFLKARGEIRDWEYEAHTFVFEVIKRGTRSYTPDFRVDHNDGSYEWHEVKGWMDDKSRIKLARMRKYYPTETLLVIDGNWFKQARRSGLSGILQGWE